MKGFITGLVAEGLKWPPCLNVEKVLNSFNTSKWVLLQVENGKQAKKSSFSSKKTSVFIDSFSRPERFPRHLFFSISFQKGSSLS
jgi:hypothetical protein